MIVRKTLTTEFKMPAVFFRTVKPLKKWAFAFFPDKSATFFAGRLCITKKHQWNASHAITLASATFQLVQIHSF